ncbi:hypothetical protein N7466_007509 [Penicillium verhagenii]|uniref:uncharacterized protein n=1 Tax=Penicillium verhagenii TaxID=1562060 RepID=UPI0025454A0C|nr:uncharacterized protein N7466_007509 [Penicillium verhagenii]KAJ5928553.1 hypothetical protein N7466_007509 [Penicillium verhagenii]
MMRFVIIFLAIATFAVILWPSSGSVSLPLHAQSNITISSKVKCDPDVDRLRRMDVAKLAKYTRREIIAEFSLDDLPMTQQVDLPMMDQKVNPPKPGATPGAMDGCTVPTPLTITVPQPPKLPDASHIDFGVATTVSRLNESLDQFVHWAGYTRTRIFALIEPDESGLGVQSVRAKADAMGINLIITEAEDDYLHRGPASSMTTPFSPSMPALVDALGAYDHTKPMYIGGLSEGVPQIAVFGLIAFGGAGVFLSRPLLSDLTAVYDECEQMTFTGDRRIAQCIYQYTTTRMTVDHRFHQLDLMRDASGFFESGRELPLSVHHWKSWFQADIPKLSVISELCGPTCLLRRWKFSDGWMLTNGFSVVKYGWMPGPNDLSMEMTWEPHNGANSDSYLHELGPLRHKDDEKVSYLLVDSAVDENGGVSQWYIKRDANDGDEILELSWRKQQI